MSDKGQRLAPLGWIVARDGHEFMPVQLQPGHVRVLREGLPVRGIRWPAANDAAEPVHLTGSVDPTLL